MRRAGAAGLLLQCILYTVRFTLRRGGVHSTALQSVYCTVSQHSAAPAWLAGIHNTFVISSSHTPHNDMNNAQAVNPTLAHHSLTHSLTHCKPTITAALCYILCRRTGIAAHYSEIIRHQPYIEASKAYTRQTIPTVNTESESGR